MRRLLLLLAFVSSFPPFLSAQYVPISGSMIQDASGALIASDQMNAAYATNADHAIAADSATMATNAANATAATVPTTVNHALNLPSDFASQSSTSPAAGKFTAATAIQFSGPLVGHASQDALIATTTTQQMSGELTVSGPLPAGVLDPVQQASLPAAGNNATTMGSVDSGSTSLTAASISGWAVGMGIAIAGAGASGAELVTRVLAINGNAITIATAAATTVTSAIIHHDDTDAIQNLVNNNFNVYLRPGIYNVTSAISITAPVDIHGPGGAQTTIQNRSKASDTFFVQFAQGPGPFGAGPRISGIQIVQDPTVTPTGGGYGLHFKNTSGLVVRDVFMVNMWGGIYSDIGNCVNFIVDVRITNGMNLGGRGIYYNTPIPCGDNHFEDVQLDGNGAPMYIDQSDTQTFSNIKVNAAQGVVFGAGGVSGGSINNVRFVNPSIEGLSSCAFDFTGGTLGSIEIIGGEFESTANLAFCNAQRVAGLNVFGFLNGSNQTSSTSVQNLQVNSWSNGPGFQQLSMPTVCAPAANSSCITAQFTLHPGLSSANYTPYCTLVNGGQLVVGSIVLATPAGFHMTVVNNTAAVQPAPTGMSCIVFMH